MCDAFVDTGPVMNLWNAPPLYMVLFGLAGIVVWHLIPQRLSTIRLKSNRLLSRHVDPAL
ncbi:hypothetical protein C770_GR4pC0215 (plasmid) [Sinorhizobium meliloti GR4]|nr:hypothetical protein C770_GR4pC0215 [Sinorhizobium meliloti GR4]